MQVRGVRKRVLQPTLEQRYASKHARQLHSTATPRWGVGGAQSYTLEARCATLAAAALSDAVLRGAPVASVSAGDALLALLARGDVRSAEARTFAYVEQAILQHVGAGLGDASVERVCAVLLEAAGRLRPAERANTLLAFGAMQAALGRPADAHQKLQLYLNDRTLRGQAALHGVLGLLALQESQQPVRGAEQREHRMRWLSRAAGHLARAARAAPRAYVWAHYAAHVLRAVGNAHAALQLLLQYHREARDDRRADQALPAIGLLIVELFPERTRLGVRLSRRWLSSCPGDRLAYRVALFFCVRSAMRVGDLLVATLRHLFACVADELAWAVLAWVLCASSELTTVVAAAARTVTVEFSRGLACACRLSGAASDAVRAVLAEMDAVRLLRAPRAASTGCASERDVAVLASTAVLQYVITGSDGGAALPACTLVLSIEAACAAAGLPEQAAAGASSAAGQLASAAARSSLPAAGASSPSSPLSAASTSPSRSRSPSSSSSSSSSSTRSSSSLSSFASFMSASPRPDDVVGGAPVVPGGWAGVLTHAVGVRASTSRSNSQVGASEDGYGDTDELGDDDDDDDDEGDDEDDADGDAHGDDGDSYSADGWRSARHDSGMGSDLFATPLGRRSGWTPGAGAGAAAGRSVLARLLSRTPSLTPVHASRSRSRSASLSASQQSSSGDERARRVRHAARFRTLVVPAAGPAAARADRRRPARGPN
jgi:hypothetical protein